MIYQKFHMSHWTDDDSAAAAAATSKMQLLIFGGISNLKQ